jgi:hypothetical protein
MNYEYLCARIARRRRLSVPQFMALHARLCGYSPALVWEGESGAVSLGCGEFPGVEVFFDAEGHFDWALFHYEPW